MNLLLSKLENYRDVIMSNLIGNTFRLGFEIILLTSREPRSTSLRTNKLVAGK
jgi:hypothetical protein